MTTDTGTQPAAQQNGRALNGRPLTAGRATAGRATAGHTVLATRLGELTIVRDGELLTGLYFPHHWHKPSPASFGRRSDDGFAEVTRQLGEYLDGIRTEFDLPIDARGTGFQRKVWELIADIPYGQTASYGDLARRLAVAPTRGTSAPRWAATR